MASENSIHLVKDFIIPKTALQGSTVSVTNANVPKLDPNSFGQGLSIYAKEILECVQMLMGSKFIHFFVHQSCLATAYNAYYLHINSAFCQSVKRALPKHSIQVLATVKYSGKTDINTYDRRFDVSELDPYGNFYQTVFDNCHLPLESDVTVNIFIRWPESNTSKIKLSTDSFLQNLFEKESSKDMKIVAGNGAEVKCHRIVFEAHSDVLTAMLSPENGLSESKTGNVVLKENSEEGIRLFIRYLYGMEMITKDLSCDVTVELFQLAHKYAMKELEDFLNKLLLQKGSDWYRPDSLLELYFHVKNLNELTSLHNHALSIIMSLSKEVRTCERFKQLHQTDSAAALELTLKLLDLVT